jgi:hypothetical protein
MHAAELRVELRRAGRCGQYIPRQSETDGRGGNERERQSHTGTTEQALEMLVLAPFGKRGVDAGHVDHLLIIKQFANQGPFRAQ